MSKKKVITNELPLRELLASTNHEKLVDILLSLHEENEEFQKQLDVIFAGLENDPKKITSMIKKEIASLKRSSRFLDSYETYALSVRLNNLRLRIANDLSEKSPDIAFKIMFDFLNLHIKILERSYDRDGAIRGVFISACENLGEIVKDVEKIDAQEIIEIVFTKFMSDLYGVYDCIIYSFKNILKDQGLDILRKRLENAINSDNVSQVKLGLKSIADCKNDVEQYIEACLFKDVTYLSDHLEIAERYIKHWESQKALEWLDNINISSGHPLQSRKKSLKIQALELDGDYSQAQEERISWFKETLNLEVYGEILSAASDDFKKKFQRDAIKIASNFPEPHMGLAFLVEIHEFEELAKFVYDNFDKFEGRHYYVLRPAAELLKRTDPFAATLLYRKMIKPILDGAKSKYYNYAVKDLIMCDILSSEITNWKHLQDHEAYFNEIVTDHSRKRRFWVEYESALKKQIQKIKKDTS